MTEKHNYTHSISSLLSDLSINHVITSEAKELILLQSISKEFQTVLPYFFGYKTEFFPS